MKSLISKNVSTPMNEEQANNYFCYNGGLQVINADLSINSAHQLEWLQPLKRTSRTAAVDSQAESYHKTAYDPFDGVEYNESPLDYAYRKLFGHSFSGLISRSMKNHFKTKSQKQKQLFSLY